MLLVKVHVFSYSDGYDSPCCKDCLYNNSTGILCREADPTTCKGSTYCDGKSAQCPVAPNMPDGAKCIDRLICCPYWDDNHKSVIRVLLAFLFDGSKSADTLITHESERL